MPNPETKNSIPKTYKIIAKIFLITFIFSHPTNGKTNIQLFVYSKRYFSINISSVSTARIPVKKAKLLRRLKFLYFPISIHFIYTFFIGEVSNTSDSFFVKSHNTVCIELTKRWWYLIGDENCFRDRFGSNTGKAPKPLRPSAFRAGAKQ